MIYVFIDLQGNEHVLTNTTAAEEKIEIVSKKVVGYRARNGLGYVDISKETYEAIIKSHWPMSSEERAKLIIAVAFSDNPT